MATDDDAVRKPGEHSHDFATASVLKEERLIDPMGSGQLLVSLRTVFRNSRVGETRNGLDDIPERMRSPKSRTTYTVETVEGRPGARLVTSESPSMTVQIAVPADALKSRSGATQKIFSLLTDLLNKTPPPDAVSPGTTDFPDATEEGRMVSFPLDTLIRLGIYKSRWAARRGWLTESAPLRAISVRWAVREKGKNPETPSAGAGGMFREFLLSGDEKTCIATLNPYVPWKDFFRLYAPRPKYWYKLPIDALQLLERILEISVYRQGQIADCGWFDLSIDSVVNGAGFPMLSTCRRPTQQIFNPLKKALERNNMESRKAFKDDVRIVERKDGTRETEGEGVILSVLYGEDGAVEGVRAAFGGEMRQGFIDREADRTRKIRQREQLILNAREKGMAMAEARRIEAERKRTEETSHAPEK